MGESNNFPTISQTQEEVYAVKSTALGHAQVHGAQPCISAQRPAARNCRVQGTPPLAASLTTRACSPDWQGVGTSRPATQREGARRRALRTHARPSA
eukprot:572392-Alexandrium_andersonii.AAC.1